MRAALGLAVSLGLGAAWQAQAQQQGTMTPQVPQGTRQAQGTFLDALSQQAGTAHLAETRAGVLITVELRGLPPGVHGFHIHETGRCDASGGFQSAGGHHNPRNEQHGFMARAGAHAGDLPNQTVGQDGVLRVQVLNDKVTLGQGEATLFDPHGSALVVHAQADDYRSQPAGDSGDRLACAVLQRLG
jgi:Cu-Zn family superoxide dismutase